MVICLIDMMSDQRKLRCGRRDNLDMETIKRYPNRYIRQADEVAD